MFTGVPLNAPSQRMHYAVKITTHSLDLAYQADRYSGQKNRIDGIDTQITMISSGSPIRQ